MEEEEENQRRPVARPMMMDEEGKRGSWAGIHGEQVLKGLVNAREMMKRKMERRAGSVKETVRRRVGMIEARVTDTSVQVVAEVQKRSFVVGIVSSFVYTDISRQNRRNRTSLTRHQFA